MAISKQYLKTKPVCKVTFTVPAETAETVAVVGSFNDWDHKATPLKKLKNGTFKGVVSLDTDTSYEFRYLVDGEFVNEIDADEQVWNDFADAENSVLKI
ncbi:isoamylase early set domain-containing protein [Formosa algae]|uniref:1,4-alpha-glucan branching enzyme n=1 Tax=Formosa algae TaxID=225843 RepID=A0A9X0YI92_9FLAO|nr:isoamylase early set domain-containing protein [Formosa algae]MBP1838303.1 1,4-alpha-glucan branching enzyme [Formosa algae]MDQ0334438.1 1,4-alpha-glucan branching enzyme [Formosa algae]OEI82141.1 glycoside hydrolase [Formosa algae]PNW29990.1 glycoside hydrolase [Formosa algae]